MMVFMRQVVTRELRVNMGHMRQVLGQVDELERGAAMVARTNGADVARGEVTQGNYTGGSSAPHFDSEPRSGRVPVRVSAGGPTTWRECGECGAKVSWEGVIYRVERIRGSFVSSQTLCPSCFGWYKVTVR